MNKAIGDLTRLYKNIILSIFCYAMLAYTFSWENGWQSFLLFILLIMFFSGTGSLKTPSKKYLTIAVSVIYSLFIVLGYSYNVNGNWSLVITKSLKQMMISGLTIVAMCILLFRVICTIDMFADKLNDGKGVSGILKKHPFAISFIALFVLYIPYFIASYPVILQGDALSNHMAAYKSSVLYLNDLIPLAFVFLLRFFVTVGNLVFKSSIVGIFLYSIFQYLIVSSVIAFSISILVKFCNIPFGVYVFDILFFAFVPIVQNYMFLETKDVLYAAFLQLFLSVSIALLWGEQKKLYVIYIISAICMMLFRNDAPYVLMLSSVIVAVFVKRVRKVAIATFAGALVFFVLYSNVFPSLIGIQRNSSKEKELFVIPVMQIARCIQYHDAEISDEDKAIIDKVFGYEEGPYCLKYNYDPIYPAMVIEYYKCPPESDIKDFWRVWAKLLVKYPSTCIQAVLHLESGYYYPGDQKMKIYEYYISSIAMENLSGVGESEGIYFKYPESLDGFRENYRNYQQKLTELPIVAAFMIPAVYLWILIYCLYYSIRHKNDKGIYLLISSFVVMLVCFVAPHNAFYGRYLYPVIMCMPLTLCGSIFGVEKQSEQNNV